MATERYVCIHGHFYQPPRENPWLEAVEHQESARPYHDWNARITDECYGPNGSARIIDHQGWLLGISNNYSRMSFNFGPTLLSWLEEHAHEAYQAILAADLWSTERFAGHGSALAQSYNHLIMPLANERDRITQTIWGMRDFEHRFGRKPEGMWLPETAACTRSLETLASHGIKFTILAPRQAKRFRMLTSDDWTDCSKSGIDPSRAYLCRLPSGNIISLFFYDGPVSQAVAFEQLLNNGENFAQRISETIANNNGEPRLAHIATDGETYGHHHRYGEMALAYALNSFEKRSDLTLTNYAEFLDRHPPQYEAEVHDNSSWSCVHGIERWRSDCGCSTGGNATWNQAWRAPLRVALDRLRDRLSIIFETAGNEIFVNPWNARDEYIDVILLRTQDRVTSFLNSQCKPDVIPEKQMHALRLLEMQRHAMLMYTSCGWFFDDLGGLETVQILLYAARAIQLAGTFTEDDLEEDFLKDLDKALSNPPHRRTGRQIYNDLVRPSIVDLARVGAHYAVSTLFDDGQPSQSVYCYEARLIDCRRSEAGRALLRVGRVCLTSRITLDSDDISFAVLHLGDHIINGGARHFLGDTEYSDLLLRLEDAFDRADFGALLGIMDRAFGTSSYSLGSLFADEQRRVLDRILSDTIERLAQTYHGIHERLTPLMRFLASLQISPPQAMTFPAEFVVHNSIENAINTEQPDPEEILKIVSEARRQSIHLQRDRLAFDYEAMLIRVAGRATQAHDPIPGLHRLIALVKLLEHAPGMKINLAPIQLAVYRMVDAEIDGHDPEILRNDRPERLVALRHACESLRVRHDGLEAIPRVTPTDTG